MTSESGITHWFLSFLMSPFRSWINELMLFPRMAKLNRVYFTKNILITNNSSEKMVLINHKIGFVFWKVRNVLFIWMYDCFYICPTWFMIMTFTKQQQGIYTVDIVYLTPLMLCLEYSRISRSIYSVLRVLPLHYGDVTMGAIASQITSLTIVCSTVYSDADQRKHQSHASLAFVWGIHRGPVNSPHKWPVTRKIFPFDDVIMLGLLVSPAHKFYLRALLSFEEGFQLPTPSQCREMI